MGRTGAGRQVACRAVPVCPHSGAMMSRPRHRALLAAAVLLGGCSVERAPQGRPVGAIAASGDSVATAEVTAALKLYYARVTARRWHALARSFWPRVTISAIRGGVETSPIELMIKRAAGMKDCPVSMAAEMLRANVQAYGPLADAWVTYRVRCGVRRDSVTTHYGIDAFHLLRHGGEWRISSLSYTHEIPGAPLNRP